jgi:hypothetical protein
MICTHSTFYVYQLTLSTLLITIASRINSYHPVSNFQKKFGDSIKYNKNLVRIYEYKLFWL